MKELLLLSLLFGSSFGLISCGNDEKKNQDPQPAEATSTEHGTWFISRVESLEYDDQNVVIFKKVESFYPQYSISFSPSGTFTASLATANTKTGSYETDGKLLFLAMDSSSVAYVSTGIYKIDTLNSNRFVFTRNLIDIGTEHRFVTIFRALR